MGDRELVLARWGLVPYFTKDLKDIKGLPTINARAETITKAPTWREPFRKRRCLVPVSSFYEWPKTGNPPKQPYAFELSSGGTFAFAGLWDAWKDRTGIGYSRRKTGGVVLVTFLAFLDPSMGALLQSKLST